ncbi:MAG: YigZ family protein [Clostridia bacterium]|nr:YigZ family protein [Clostridia bacterium]
MLKYKTIKKEATAEQVIERSRFISYIASAGSREEAEAFIASIKEKHRDATHNVPAYIIGPGLELQWASDDGEPSGTSGAPMLHLLSGQGITNVVIVVTRYFGGIKLGTGGLMRAYTSSARLALEAAGICGVQDMSILRFRIDYRLYGKLQNMEAEGKFRIADAQFTDAVEMTLELPLENEQEIRGIISELTNGAVNEKNMETEHTLGKFELQEE